MVAIRLARHGAKKAPFYRIVATDSRNPRDGRFIEVLGTWNPVSKDKGSAINIKSSRMEYWLGVGAVPTDTVKRLIKSSGALQPAAE
ncbi:MAG: 30S ribosomal protein S16 [Rickettsiales bacterium]|nr:30S ribosomal protein S16 [Rickettsiales bacterium]|tara:strand:- start:6056 stop:6316 length:261 start_codon:yes stop_codon:yes gene_type:complete